MKQIQKCLKSKIIRTCIFGSRLIGVFGVANSNGLVLPSFVGDEEIRAIKASLPVNVGKIESKMTAFGNLVLVNDNGGIVSNLLLKERGLLFKIKEILDIELVSGMIAGHQCVGALAVATNKGVLTHPFLRDAEHQLLSEVLKVKVDVGTINGGCPFIASGILANDYGIVVGDLTNGPETMIISNVFE